MNWITVRESQGLADPVQTPLVGVDAATTKRFLRAASAAISDVAAVLHRPRLPMPVKR